MSAEQEAGVLPYPGWENVGYFTLPRELERAILMQIPRFHAIPEMSQRTKVAEHSVRVMSFGIHFAYMLLELGVEIDQPHIIFMSDHHDDCEMVTGDIPTPVKTNATPEQKKQMEKDELEAATRVDHLVAKPSNVPSFRDAFEEYRKQETLEARFINFWDKWDGLHEAMHEVITGTNKDGFRQVIREYKPAFEKLREKNKDWMEVLELYFGEHFFDFPDPDLLTPKTVDQVDFTNARTFIESLASGNPSSYERWLSLNKAAFTIDLIQRTFPGWIDLLPDPVADDIIRVSEGRPRPHSGLILPGTFLNREMEENPTFGESLLIEETLDEIDEQAESIRARTGRKSASRRFYFSVYNEDVADLGGGEQNDVGIR